MLKLFQQVKLKPFFENNYLMLKSIRTCSNNHKERNIEKIAHKITSPEKQKLIEEKFNYLKNYTCVYRFNHINLLTMISRFKIYQTAFTIVAGASTSIMYFINSNITQTSFLLINIASLSALMTLLIISKYLINVICAIYIHKNEKDIIISHINFFSRRKDIFTTIDNVKPLINSMEELNNPYLKFQLNNSNGTMYYSLKRGKILSQNDLYKVLKIIE